MTTKLENLKCPIVSCTYIARDAGKIKRLEMIYEHVSKCHPFDIPKGGYTMTCPKKGCGYAIQKYDRANIPKLMLEHMGKMHILG